MSSVFVYRLQNIEEAHQVDFDKGLQDDVLDRQAFLLLVDWLASERGIALASEERSKRTGGSYWKVTSSDAKKILTQLRKKPVRRVAVERVATNYGAEEDIGGNLMWNQYLKFVASLETAVYKDECLVFK